MMRFLCALLLVVLSLGCFQSCGVGVYSPPPTVETVPGRYIGRYQDGEETFELKTGFTFTQEFRKNGAVVYRHEGRWYIKDEDVVFDPLVVAIPLLTSGSDKKAAHWGGRWVAVGGGQGIVLSEDFDYYISKR